MTVRVACPASLTPRVTEILGSHPATSSMSVQVGVSVIPEGDVVRADLPREAVNDVVEALVALGVHEEGTIQLLPVTTWVSRRGLAAEQLAEGASADAVVWAEVTERAYEDSAVTWTFMSFMVLATLLAGIAVVTDSVILIIGAMVLGPEFVPIAALGLGLVRRRFALVRQAIRTLAVGFAVAISAVTLLALLARAVGLVSIDQIGPDTRPGTDFIYSPNVWSLIIAIIAGAAGVLALTSAKSGALAGVFISVTTIPAAGNIAVAIAFAEWNEVVGSSLNLTINIVGMALAGWATLALQQRVWGRVRRRRARS